jgi:hypothetical protein
MNLSWESVKEYARLLYEKAAQLFLFQAFVGYLVACAVTGHVLGIAGFVAFLNHCCQWGAISKWKIQ